MGTGDNVYQQCSHGGINTCKQGLLYGQQCLRYNYMAKWSLVSQSAKGNGPEVYFFPGSIYKDRVQYQKEDWYTHQCYYKIVVITFLKSR